jgi:hypothetical protein
MKADARHAPTFSRAQARRIDEAGAIVDRLDIARKLIELHAPDNRLALARQLLRQTADDVATMAGIEDETTAARREAEAIRRAAGAPA